MDNGEDQALARRLAGGSGPSAGNGLAPRPCRSDGAGLSPLLHLPLGLAGRQRTGRFVAPLRHGPRRLPAVGGKEAGDGRKDGSREPGGGSASGQRSSSRSSRKSTCSVRRSRPRRAAAAVLARLPRATLRRGRELGDRKPPFMLRGINPAAEFPASWNMFNHLRSLLTSRLAPRFTRSRLFAPCSPGAEAACAQRPRAGNGMYALKRAVGRRSRVVLGLEPARDSVGPRFTRHPSPATRHASASWFWCWLDRPLGGRLGPGGPAAGGRAEHLVRPLGISLPQPGRAGNLPGRQLPAAVYRVGLVRGVDPPHLGPQNKAPIVIWPYPIEPKPGGPLAAEFDLLHFGGEKTPQNLAAASMPRRARPGRPHRMRRRQL